MAGGEFFATTSTAKAGSTERCSGTAEALPFQNKVKQTHVSQKRANVGQPLAVHVNAYGEPLQNGTEVTVSKKNSLP
jgi:hypothetical protein